MFVRVGRPFMWRTGVLGQPSGRVAGVPPVRHQHCAGQPAPIQGRPYPTTIFIVRPPPPSCSTLSLVVWWGIWQWISQVPFARAVQTTS